MWNRSSFGCVLAIAIAARVGCRSAGSEPSGSDKSSGMKDTSAKQFLDSYREKIRPLEKQANLAWWEANTTGDDAAFERRVEFSNRIDEILSDGDAFARLKKIRESKSASDPVERRGIEVVYLAYLGKQVDPSILKAMNEKSTAVEKRFNAYRGVVDGKEVTDNEVREILKTSADSELRRKAWEASKGVGPLLLDDLKELVRLRNDAARKLGFANFYDLSLALNEQTEKDVVGLFGELDRLTRGPFLGAKGEADATLARRYGITPDELRPWHYDDPFFQEAPKVYDVDLDAIYAKVDVPKTCREFYAGIGLPIDDVIARSDLYEKPKKSPHAFCTNIDRGEDVRVLANIAPNEYWTETMLHELGHAVYEKGFRSDLPWELRAPSHTHTTEGIAMLFGRLSKSAP